MKKLIVLIIGVCCLTMPISAATNFYVEESSGQIIWGATDCSGEEHLVAVLDKLPDDPPTGATASNPDDDDPAAAPTEEDPAANEENPAPTENPATSGINTVEASQELINILLGRNDPQVTNKTLLTQKAAEMSDEDIDNVDFEDLQEMLLAFVRDVNWKTGLKITYRDLTWFNRLKMACRGINQMTKPVRANFEAYIGDISSSLDQASDAIVDHLATSSRGHSFDSMARLSVVGLVNAIDTKNPFLLMLVDHETYNQLVSIDPKIAQLYQDMFTFFKIRAVRMTGADYDRNTKELIRVSKLGEGNYISTWHAMAEYAQKMMVLDRRGLLNQHDEKDIHIVRLEASIRYIKEQTRVEKRAAEIAMADPNNAAMVYELQHGAKKKPSLDEKALDLLKTLTPEQTKALIFKYKMK